MILTYQKNTDLIKVEGTEILDFIVNPLNYTSISIKGTLNKLTPIIRDKLAVTITPGNPAQSAAVIINVSAIYYSQLGATNAVTRVLYNTVNSIGVYNGVFTSVDDVATKLAAAINSQSTAGFTAYAVGFFLVVLSPTYLGAIANGYTCKVDFSNNSGSGSSTTETFAGATNETVSNQNLDYFYQDDTAIYIKPQFFNLTTFQDGVYKIEVTLMKPSNSTTIFNCLFVDKTIKCKLSSYLEDLIEDKDPEKIASNLILYHYALINGSNCNCACDDLLNIFIMLSSILTPNIQTTDCGC